MEYLIRMLEGIAMACYFMRPFFRVSVDNNILELLAILPIIKPIAMISRKSVTVEANVIIAGLV